MSEFPSQRDDRLSEPAVGSATAILDEMHQLVRSAAATAPPGSSVKACILQAARRLGLTYARARAHWYREARSVSATEWLAAEEARMRLRRERAAQLRAELAALEDHDGLATPARGEHMLVDRGPLP